MKHEYNQQPARECPFCKRVAKPIYFDAANLTEDEKVRLAEACGYDYVLLSGPDKLNPWLPIESAPRTGIAVLLWQPWKSGRDCTTIGHYANGWCDRFNEELAPDPTHWQPLPAPPGPAKECAHQWRVDPDFGEGSGYLYCPRCDCTRRSPTPPDSGEK